VDPAEDALAALGPVTSSGPTSPSASAYFAGTLPVFAGHFPGAPLVPGVHQVALVAELARRGTGNHALLVAAIVRCKWSLPVCPGDDLVVTASWRQDGAYLLVDGTVARGGAVSCSCRLRLAENSPFPLGRRPYPIASTSQEVPS